MDAGLSSARQARAQHRHELRTLTYVTLDQANGGIVRNLSANGIGVQAVAAIRPQQQVRVRFELRYPRLPVETQAEVVWSTFSGQCGFRFLNPKPELTRQISRWIFGDLLERISLHEERSGTIFAPAVSAPQEEAPMNGNGSGSVAVEGDDGLIVSPMPLKVIELPVRPLPPESIVGREEIVHPPMPSFLAAPSQSLATELDWLSRPLSGRALAWTIDGLMIFASLLLFALVFLSVAREAPRWPLAIAVVASAVMAGVYWLFFRLMAGVSLGTRLARLAESDRESGADETRFR